MRSIKCLIVGDGSVGKTCMLTAYKSNKTPEVSGYYNSTIEVTVDEKTVNLLIFDFPSSLERILPQFYPKTDIFLVCFSLANSTSFENIETRWYPEIKRYCPKTPIILVGTKADLNAACQEKLEVSGGQGHVLAKKIEAVKYLECSALENKGIEEVLEEAVRAVFVWESLQKRFKNCAIL